MNASLPENSPDFYRQVYAVVRRVPRGRVTTYGRIARMLGHADAARAVGYALNALGGKRPGSPDDDVPWQRVINSQGRISIPNTNGAADRQAALLRAEGVVVGEDLRVDLSVYLWEGLHLLDIDDIIAGRGSGPGPA